MRVLIFAALLLGSSSLSPSFAQESAKPAVEAPQTTVPGRIEQNADQPRDQRAGRDQSRAEDRTVGPDWRMRRGDDERLGRDRREMGSEGRMRRDGDRAGRDNSEIGTEGRARSGGDRIGRDEREMGPDQRMQRDRDGDRGGRYAGREDRGGYGERDQDDRGSFNEDRPRQRVKICIEYDNGDEYCRYRR